MQFPGTGESWGDSGGIGKRGDASEYLGRNDGISADAEYQTADESHTFVHRKMHCWGNL